MLTKNKTEISGTPGPAQSSKRAGTAISSNREGERAEARHTAAKDLKHRVLDRWENEGGSASDVDTVATQTGDQGR